MRLVPILVGLILVSGLNFAQSETDTGVPVAAFSGLANPNCRTLFGNPAALCGEKQSLNLGYRNAFLLPDLQRCYISYIFSKARWSSGMGLVSYGYSHYRDQSLLLGMGRSYDRLTLAYRVAIRRLDLGEYGTKSTLNLSLGFRYAPSATLSLGACVNNVSNSRLSRNDWGVSPSLQCGISKKWAKSLRFNAGLQQQASVSLSLLLGLEYMPKPSFFILSGFQSGQNSFHLGLQMPYKTMSLLLAFYTHPRLSISPQIEYHASF